MLAPLTYNHAILLNAFALTNGSALIHVWCGLL